MSAMTAMHLNKIVHLRILSIQSKKTILTYLGSQQIGVMSMESSAASTLPYSKRTQSQKSKE